MISDPKSESIIILVLQVHFTASSEASTPWSLHKMQRWGRRGKTEQYWECSDCTVALNWQQNLLSQSLCASLCASTAHLSLCCVTGLVAAIEFCGAATQQPGEKQSKILKENTLTYSCYSTVLQHQWPFFLCEKNTSKHFWRVIILWVSVLLS